MHRGLRGLEEEVVGKRGWERQARQGPTLTADAPSKNIFREDRASQTDVCGAGPQVSPYPHFSPVSSFPQYNAQYDEPCVARGGFGYDYPAVPPPPYVPPPYPFFSDGGVRPPVEASRTHVGIRHMGYPRESVAGPSALVHSATSRFQPDFGSDVHRSVGCLEPDAIGLQFEPRNDVHQVLRHGPWPAAYAGGWPSENTWHSTAEGASDSHFTQPIAGVEPWSSGVTVSNKHTGGRRAAWQRTSTSTV